MVTSNLPLSPVLSHLIHSSAPLQDLTTTMELEYSSY